MGFIDDILGFFGLQRKSTTHQETTPPAQEEKSSLDRVSEYRRSKFDEMWERQSKAVTDFTNTLYAKQSEKLEEFTRKIKDGSLKPGEYKEYMLTIFGTEDFQKTELPENIKQALRDALEKRGREDEEGK